MEAKIMTALQSLKKSVSVLDKSVAKHEQKLVMIKGEPELFAFANENDKKFKKALADKLDNTIERLETLLAEE